MADHHVEARRDMSLRRRVTEYFTLREALREVAAIDADARARARAALEQANETRRAAEQLLVNRANAAGIALARESLTHMRGALTPLGFPDERLLALAAAIGEAPRFDKDAKPAQITAATAALGRERSLERQIEVKLADRNGLLRLRAIRVVRAAAVLLVLVVLGRIVTDAFFGPRVQASSEASPVFAAERAVDGDIDTDWMPQDGASSWLELTWRTRRRVHVIRLMNGHARYNGESGDVRVELYDGATLLRTVTGTFVGTPPKTYLLLDAGGVRCNRLRIYVNGTKAHVPAIAEVSVD